MATVAKVFTVAAVGYDGHLIEVESDSAKGLPGLQIVGMGSKAIDEAKERVRSAINNSLLEFPAKKITINLAPAELPKDGTLFDVPIALAILTSAGQLRQSELAGAVFVGELALNGTIRPIRGAITVAETAKRCGLSTVYVPAANLSQASLVEGVEVIGVASLKDIFLHLKKERRLKAYTPPKKIVYNSIKGPFLDDIHGQDQAKRAAIIAAAGRHNLLLSGSPGAGKTMLAQTLTGLLPALSADEQIAVTKLHSLAGEAVEGIITTRPFRSPHHTASRISLVGGGNRPLPGEISLAHLGVLFLDEIPEYPRATLEALRQPLEDKKISISRANGKVHFPADFMLVATMNPCPCGYYGDKERECSCSTTQILTYQKRLSGPLLDRIDMHLHLSRTPHATLLEHNTEQKTQHIAAITMIKNAHALQSSRYNSSYFNNGNIQSAQVKKYISLSLETKKLLNAAADRLHLSARSYFKIIKVARTIADLDDAPDIATTHLSEALQYRQFTS